MLLNVSRTAGTESRNLHIFSSMKPRFGNYIMDLETLEKKISTLNLSYYACSTGLVLLSIIFKIYINMTILMECL